MKRQIIFLLSIWLLLDLNSFAQNTVKTNLNFDLAKANLAKQVEGFKEILEEFNVTYEKYLIKLEGELKAEGELEQLLLVRKERAEFRKGTQPGTIKFVKLQQMRSIYSKGREKRRDRIANDLMPVFKAHLGDLGEIRKTLTIADKIDEALIVRKEENRIKLLMGDPIAAVFTLGIFWDPFTAVAAMKSQPLPKKVTPAIPNKDAPMTDIASAIIGGEYKLYRSSAFIVSMTFDANGKVKVIGSNGVEHSQPWKITDGVLQYYFNYITWVDVEVTKGGKELSFTVPDNNKTELRYRK